MATLSLKDVRKNYGKTEVIHGVSIDIADGEFVVIVGPSGCGKSTLLRMVAGLEEITAGTIEIGGKVVNDLEPRARDIAMVFQNYALYPHMSVFDNMAYGLRIAGVRGDDLKARVAKAAEMLDLSALLDRKPRQLSGGQQQRAALARAIVSDPKVLLLDEPLSNLDARLREDMQVELIEIHKRLGLTTLFVTHDQEEALSLSDRIILINQGRIEQQGAPAEIYARPGTEFASSFLGSANLLPATVENGRDGPEAVLADGQRLALPKDSTATGAITVALRQEDLSMSPPTAEGLNATVRARVFLGARNRYVVTVAGMPVRVLTANDVAFRSGDAVSISIDRERVRVLPR